MKNDPHIVVAEHSPDERARNQAITAEKVEKYAEKPPALPTWQENPTRWRGILPDTYGELLAVTKMQHPDWSAKAVEWQARKLYSRYPLIKAAIEAAMAQGRDIRERMEHKTGVMWPEMSPLYPIERTFVIETLKRLLNVKKPRQ